MQKLDIKACALIAVVPRKFLFFKMTPHAYKGVGVNPYKAYEALMPKIPEKEKHKAMYFPIVGNVLMEKGADGQNHFDVDTSRLGFMVNLWYDYTDLMEHVRNLWNPNDTIYGGVTSDYLENLKG